MKVKKPENILKKCCKEDNSSWVSKYSIQIYSCIAISNTKKLSKKKYNKNVKLYNMHLNGKRIKMASNVIIYCHKNILQV